MDDKPNPNAFLQPEQPGGSQASQGPQRFQHVPPSEQQTLRQNPLEQGKKPATQTGSPKADGDRAQSAKRFALDNFVPMVIGIVGAVIIYKAMLPFFPETGLLGDIKQKLMVHPYIPPACTWLLCWHITYVLFRLIFKVRTEFKVIAENPIPRGVEELTDDDITVIAKSAMDIERRYGPTLLTRRIFLAVQHLGISRDTAELGDLLRRRADADRQRAITAYLWPQYIVWAIPILGFIGTVLGIGSAVGGLKETITDEGGITTALSAVTGDLGVAFDTTLVALVMSVIALMVQTLVSQQESLLLADVEDYLTYRLQSRIQTETMDQRVEAVLEQSLGQLNQLQERLNAEQGERSSVAMQTIMRAQEDIKATLGSMPEHIEKSAKVAADLLKETRNMLMQIGQQASENLIRAFGEAVGFTKQELAEMRRGINEDASQQAQALLALNAQSYREAVQPVAESLTVVSAHLGQILQDGQRLQQLQSALNENLNSVGKADRLDETMSEVRNSLVSLKPILDKLSRPVPLRLTLGGVELADGGGQTSVVYASGEGPRPVV